MFQKIPHPYGITTKCSAGADLSSQCVVTSSEQRQTGGWTSGLLCNPGPGVSTRVIAASIAIAALSVFAQPAVQARPSRSFDEIIDRQFLKGDAKEQSNFLLLNLQKTQQAAETYASHHKGVYSTALDDSFKSYFPMGNCDGKNYSMWSVPHNPYSGKPEWPKLGNLTSVKSASQGKLRPGELEYSPLKNGKGYIIRAGGPDGKPLRDAKGKVVVLQNDKVELLKAHGRTVQWAAERYAEEHHNLYPKTIDDEFKYCFPFGNAARKKPGNMLINPFFGKTEWPVPGIVTNIKKARQEKPGPVMPGVVEYSCIPGRKNYAIRLGGQNGFALAGPTPTRVVARDGDGSGKENRL